MKWMFYAQAFNYIRNKNMPIIDETGNTYGFLTVLERNMDNDTYGAARWNCICSCGKPKTVTGKHLRVGDVVSCGCFVAVPTNRKPHGYSNFKRLLRGYIRQADKRNYDWRLSEEDFRLLTKDICFFCGCEPSQIMEDKRSYGEYVYNGLDRFDNSLGYTIENVVSCCGDCNRMKMELDGNEFLEKISFIYENRVE